MRKTRAGTSLEREEEDGDNNEEFSEAVQQPNLPSNQLLELKLAEILQQVQSIQEELRQSRQTPVEMNVPDGVITTGSSVVGGSQTSSNIPLARKLYDLPEFDGRPEDWPMFRENFIATTTEFQYSDTQNMMRLQKALKGKARETVECLLIHCRNVSQIMKVLQERFGKPELLVKSQINKIRNFTPISEHRIEQLVVFATKVQNLSSFLQAADCDHHLSNPTLMEELLLKLPIQRRIEWARHAVSIVPRPTICHFSDWLQELSDVVNTACAYSSVESRQNKAEGRSRLFHVNEGNSDNLRIVCEVCEERHVTSKCNRFLGMSVPDRWRVVRRKRLCFNCLKKGHRSNLCGEQHTCGDRRCSKKMHALLHQSNVRGRDGDSTRSLHTSQQLYVPEIQQPLPSTSRQAVQQQQASDESVSVFTNTVVPAQTPKLFFKILPVFLYANGREIKSYAFFDEGSAISLMNRGLAVRLGLKGKNDNLTLQWFGSTTVTEPSLKVDVEISGAGRSRKKFQLQGVRTVENLQLPMQSVGLSEVHQRHRHLPIMQYSDATPELLIGLDNAHLGIPRKIAYDGSRGPAVVLTKLGWVIYGTENPLNSHAHFHSLFARVNGTPEKTEKLEKLVCEYVVNENMGVNMMKQPVEAEYITRSKKMWEENTKRIGCRYETCLLWKQDNVTLPESRVMAEKRFYSLERKFKVNNEFRCAYAAIISDYISKGYCRKLSNKEAEVRNGINWYLPHFGVYNPNKPGKLRLVFDAAAESHGISLNSRLLSGPDFSQPLTTVLMKFRQKPVGVCADIVEMFHQVRIRGEDLAAQRFLWRSDPGVPLEEYVMNVMIFGATCSPCAAQFVKNKNAERFEDKFPEATAAIKYNHYVDDFVHSFSSTEEALKVTKEVIWIHKSGGFELKRFVSNENSINDLNKGELPVSTLNLDKESSELFPKVLGMFWVTKSDELKFTLSFGKVNRDVLMMKRKPSKREVLSMTMSVFDPFGIAAEYTLEAKLILQTIWREQKEWDIEVSDAINERWKKWLRALLDLEKISVPRCYGVNFMSSSVELHVFADASESAYAAVAYWRFVGKNDVIQSTFIAGKTKCAPSKLVSVPRLELQSAVLATRLRGTILESHDKSPNRIVMWSDSKTVLSWIRSDHRRYKPYVAHRVSEILDGSDVDDWRWLPSASNPADFGTRIRDEKRESLWITGPEFLQKNEMNWPSSVICESTNVELRKRFTILLINVNTSFFKRFSSFIRLKRVVGWIMRFRGNCHQLKEARISGNLKTFELKRAETTIIRAVQKEAFPDDYHSLSVGKQPEKGSSLWTLSPTMDEEGVIRLGGRIDAAVAVPYSTRRPIILPKISHITQIIVDYYHRIWKHQNDSIIIAEIRRMYWIPHIRTEVRRATKRCPFCIKERATPRQPLMGQLPIDRLSPFVRPFTYVGLDYMGPFTTVIGRRSEKRWIALFTCLTTRAVHLELAKDLSTDACLTCIKNFMCRRGTPVRIRSDNGTNFVGADKELKRQLKEFENGQIADALSNMNIEWVFNCPLNPHAGGCWERLVRSVKRAMGHAVNGENLHEHTLYSLMCEAENIVNSRPLTHIALDEPTEPPLTPNHFLLGTPNSEQTPHPMEEKYCATRKLWRKVQQMQCRFWKKWIDEYLPDLTRRTKWCQPVTPLAVGDVVLVCERGTHQSSWPMGRVVEAFPGKDKQVRSARVQTKAGVYKRPACILAKLDIGESG